MSGCTREVGLVLGGDGLPVVAVHLQFRDLLPEPVLLHLKRVSYQVSGFEFRISGFRVSGFGVWVSGSGLRVAGFGFRVLGFGFQISSSGLRKSFGWSKPCTVIAVRIQLSEILPEGRRRARRHHRPPPFPKSKTKFCPRQDLRLFITRPQSPTPPAVSG